MSARRHVFSLGEVGVSLAVLVATTTTIYGVLWYIDFGQMAHPPGPYTLFTTPGAIGALSNLGEVTVGILGAALTVVTIIVELASNRYTPRITELFVRDPINLFMLSFFVCSSVLVVWIEMSLYGGAHPGAMVMVAVGAMTVSLLALLPYFAYVFDFLMPTRVIARIASRCVGALGRVSRGRPVAAARDEVTHAIEQLGDIGLNSVESKDKGIVIATIDALADLAATNMDMKPKLPAGWFETGPLVEDDQDFIAMHTDVLQSLERRRTWVDMKILRQYQAVYDETLVKMRDVNHLVAIRTRRIALQAAQKGDREGLLLALKFMNTFMRSALNARDQRSAFNLSSEYRGLAEGLIDGGHDEALVELAARWQFYGQLAFKLKLPFILETVAFDLCVVIERAFKARRPSHTVLLDGFLEIDRAPDSEDAQDASLRGVRKAQIKLATFYLLVGADAEARRIADDFRVESPLRIHGLIAELRAVQTPEFWEVSDRGTTFEYLPPERREQLDRLEAWFN
jgi:hypothetical protein